MKISKLVIFIIFVFTISAVAWYFLPGEKLPAGRKIDKIIVYKKKRVMQVLSGNDILKTYNISIGKNAVGDKELQGDKRTPEGTYFINAKNPGSGYHKNLGISYPNAEDVATAKLKGIDPGGDIKIHGLKNGLGFIGKFHSLLNWTAGCIAVTDEEVDELYTAVAIGTPIVIMP